MFSLVQDRPYVCAFSQLKWGIKKHKHQKTKTPNLLVINFFFMVGKGTRFGIRRKALAHVPVQPMTSVPLKRLCATPVKIKPSLVPGGWSLTDIVLFIEGILQDEAIDTSPLRRYPMERYTTLLRLVPVLYHQRVLFHFMTCNCYERFS